MVKIVNLDFLGSTDVSLLKCSLGACTYLSRPCQCVYNKGHHLSNMVDIYLSFLRPDMRSTLSKD